MRKQNKRPSASAGVTWLKTRGAAQKTTGLTFTDRTIVRSEVKARPWLWFLMAWVQTLLLTGGILLTAVTGWGVKADTIPLAVGTMLIAALWTGFFQWEKLRGKRGYLLFGSGLLYAGILFAVQRQVEQGAFVMWNAILHRINAKYHMELSLLRAGDPQNVTWFLLAAMVPVGLVLAALSVYRADGLVLSLLRIPSLAFLLLMGGTPWEGALLLLLLGILAAWAAGRSVWKKRLWGDPEEEGYRRNVVSFHAIQRKTALLVCAGSLMLSIPVTFLVQPMVTLRLRPAEQLTAAVEGQFLSLLTEWMPILSNGQLSLQTETAGSGVSDGALGETEGLVVRGVEDLRLICTEKPEETLYLKGFIGTTYESDRWTARDDSEFRSSSAGWQTEGDAALYVQNLPFLRAMYTEKQQPHLVTVQRLNASERYSYHPYNAFLSDYYKVTGGDGAVTGLGTEEERFSYFSREETARLIEEWESEKEAPSVLDRVAESYEGYVRSKNLTVPEGFEELREQCLAEGLDKEKVEDIRRYIRLFLAENYEYDLNVPSPAEDEDFLTQFLYETKRGYSAHFATAAVVMFRMFGVPARYVAGYAVPQNLFSHQSNDTWTAVAQDDNAHAWAEVYLSGIGWTPMEMTPGMVGTEQDVAYDAEMTEQTEEDEEQNEEAEQSEEESQPEPAKPLMLPWKKILVGAAATLVIGSGAAWLVILYGKHRRDYGLDGKKSLSLRGQEMFMAYHRTMVKKGMAEDTDSTSAAFIDCAKALDGELTEEEAAALVAFALKCSYSPHEPEEQELDEVRRLLKRLRKSKNKIK